jgi:hypothetical protein
MKKIILFSFLVLLLTNEGKSHEPLYGFGPHVLFKNGFAPHITLNWNSRQFETEYALGYGITRNWTMIAETPFYSANGQYNFGGVNLKSKYRFWLKAKPGISYQGSFITKLEVPAVYGQPTVLNMALTTGQEALKLYWFATAGYALKFTDNSLKPGNHLLYNVSIGFRPFKVNYYKPDIVFFLETSGRVYQKSTLNNEFISRSGGANLAIAPTFFFTYRNFAFRGGVQFGVWENGFVRMPEKNYKLTFELHI